jgi:integrase
MEYGLRIEEVLAIQKDCIQGGELIIKRSFSDGVLMETTKTKRVRIYGLTNNANRIIKSIKPALSLFLFVRDDGKHYTWKVMTKLWKKACATTGITINLNNGIRHSLGGQLLDQGVELEAVRDAYGHTSTQTTRRYAKRSQRRITDILEFRTKSAVCLLNENSNIKANGSA